MKPHRGLKHLSLQIIGVFLQIINDPDSIYDLQLRTV